MSRRLFYESSSQNDPKDFSFRKINGIWVSPADPNVKPVDLFEVCQSSFSFASETARAAAETKASQALESESLQTHPSKESQQNHQAPDQPQEK